MYLDMDRMRLSENNPLISVCIPTYNNARYIGKTLESIINQTYKNIEIIVSDNASTDNTHEIVNSFQDSRIKYFKNSEPIISLANWNLCLKMATADYVAIYHSDDIYEPEIVEREMDYFLDFPEVGAVFCLDKLIDESDNYVRNGVVLPSLLRNSKVIPFNELFSELLKSPGSFLVSPTFMAKKSVFSVVKLFRETEEFGDSFGSAADTEMWLRIAEKFPIGIVNERLVSRRISATQGSSIYEKMRTSRANHFLVLDSFLCDSSYDTVSKYTLMQYEFNKLIDDIVVAKNLIKQGKQKEATSYLLKSFSWHNLLTSFKNTKNFVKFVIYIFFLIVSLFGIASDLVDAVRFLKASWYKIRNRNLGRHFFIG